MSFIGDFYESRWSRAEKVCSAVIDAFRTNRFSPTLRTYHSDHQFEFEPIKYQTEKLYSHRWKYTSGNKYSFRCVPQLSTMTPFACFHVHFIIIGIDTRKNSACIKTITRIGELRQKGNHKKSHLFVVVYFPHSFRSSKIPNDCSCLIDSIDLVECLSSPIIFSSAA